MNSISANAWNATDAMCGSPALQRHAWQFWNGEDNDAETAKDSDQS